MSKAKELLAAGERAVVDCLMVPSEWLPAEYRGKNKMRKLSSVVAQLERKERKADTREPREINAEFHKVDGKRAVKSATAERLAILEKYANAVDNGREIDYAVNENRQWGQMVDFCLEFGITSEEEDILSTMGPLKNN
jgi:cell wall assembly regulator SMI1